MVSFKIKQERHRTAQYRFYLFEAPGNIAYPWQVLDAEADPKSLAKFKDKENAELFLGAIRHRYATGRIQ